MDKEMIDRCRLAFGEELQKINLPVGTYINSELFVIAIIKAMREPTEKMLDSIRHMEVNSEYNISSEIEYGYTTMIDAVIND